LLSGPEPVPAELAPTQSVMIKSTSREFEVSSDARGHDLHLDRISHRFGDFLALNDVQLDVAAGELMALLGPSGCGKSTLLRIVSGFIRQTQGHVLFDNECVDHLPPNRRGVGIVFQSYALFPHMTVRQNVAYGLEAHHCPYHRFACCGQSRAAHGAYRAAQ